jgi:(1->4)-alpha-D-glucan 1-alpha-D-glucosylmutase
MAKGVEDTAFYCYNRLTGMCEVGGDPGSDGVTVQEFHVYQQKMQVTHPLTMTTLSTHDTKRSDDVRARLAVLSEVTEEFEAAILRWAEHNLPYKRDGFPDPNSEYFVYQTLIGAWPIDAERMKAYLEKAMREAKLETSWVANNKTFEDAMQGFVEGILADRWFVDDLEGFVGRVLVAGRINSLAQTLVKHTAPGVPDLYQGSELWDLSLVDPDNRRPVDYELRRRILERVKALPAESLVAGLKDAQDPGLPKLALIHASLALRRQHPDWFAADAGYLPLPLQGAKAGYAVAYLRGETVLTLVPRLTLARGGPWGDTTVEIPAGSWRNRMTDQVTAGGSTQVESLLTGFPVALLVKEGD